MVTFIVKRVSSLVVVLLAMSFLVFCLQTLVPADPARSIAGPTAPIGTVDTIRERLELNDPVFVQYVRFLKNLFYGDLGTSIRTRNSVTTDLASAAPASIELSAVALMFAVAIAGVVVVLQTMYRGFGFLRFTLIGLGSAPVVLTSLLLIHLFWFDLDWLPGSGRGAMERPDGPTDFLLIDGLLSGQAELVIDSLRHLILPALALALPIAVALSQTLSSSLQTVMQEGYIRTARGKGLGPVRVLIFHGLRNAASATVAMTGLQIRLLLGGLLVVERVFSWPGIGLYMAQSFATADLPAVLGVSMALGAFYILISAAVEVAQAWADPRVVL